MSRRTKPEQNGNGHRPHPSVRLVQVPPTEPAAPQTVVPQPVVSQPIAPLPPMAGGMGWPASAMPQSPPDPPRPPGPTWQERRSAAKAVRMQRAVARVEAREARAATKAAAKAAREEAARAVREAAVREAEQLAALRESALKESALKESAPKPVVDGPGIPEPVSPAASGAAPAPSVEVPEQPPSKSAAALKAVLNRQVLTTERVRKLVVITVVITVLGGVAGFVGALVWPATYAARAQVLFPITQEQPTGFLREDRNLTTQLVLLESRAVLGRVATAEGRSVKDVDEDVSAKLVGGSELIEVEARDSSSGDAKKTLQRVVDAYLDVDQIQQAVSSRTYLQNELEQVRQQITAERDLFRDVLTSTGLASLTSATEASGRLESLTEREQDLSIQLDRLELNPTPRPQVITEPYEVDGQVSPKPLFTAATGVIAGLLVAAAVAGLIARRWARG